jgi:hypothetical protein
MPGPLYDCYVLATHRCSEIAVRFLDQFMPERRPSFHADDPAEALGLPRSSTFSEVLQFLEANPTRAYSMYWSNERAGPPYNAVLSFTEDGCLILGLSSAYDDQEILAHQTLSELKEFAESCWGYTGVEEPPAGSRNEFVSRVQSQAE